MTLAVFLDFGTKAPSDLALRPYGRAPTAFASGFPTNAMTLRWHAMAPPQYGICIQCSCGAAVSHLHPIYDSAAASAQRRCGAAVMLQIE